MSRSLNILGVTGSIGKSAMDVVLSDPARFEVCAVTAHENVEELAQAAIILRAKKAVIANPSKYDELKKNLQGTGIETGTDLIEAASEKVDITLAAIVGMAALRPVLKATENSAVLALASKEPIVAAGPLLLKRAARHKTKILPVDSEHNAIFQVSQAENPNAIEKIILTASGGPFRTWSADDMKHATPAQALAHPNWAMGEKISVDSATMMNKALEIIEAHYLFNAPPEKIKVVIHPQSIIHSMVEYKDGSILAQMGASDMRTSLSYALAWPKRMATPGKTLDFTTLKRLDFETPDHRRFPALNLAYECLRRGPAHCISLNAANEIAVEAFLCGQIAFNDIINIIEEVLRRAVSQNSSTLEEIEAIDLNARRLARNVINNPPLQKTVAV